VEPDHTCARCALNSVWHATGHNDRKLRAMSLIACLHDRSASVGDGNVLVQLISDEDHAIMAQSPETRPATPASEAASHKDGEARGFCCKDRDGPLSGRGRRCSGGDLEQPGDEGRLSSDVATTDILNLPLSDHRHRLEACQCSSCRPEPIEAEPGSSQPFHAPVVLLHDVVQGKRSWNTPQASPSFLVGKTIG
jgi:hypothetical protein